MAFLHQALKLLAIGAGAISLLHGSAQAQTAASSIEDLRPLYATSDDIRDGRELADKTCASCHGPTGVASSAATPNLAGQRPAFLYRELKGLQHGDASNGNAAHSGGLMKFLSDDALVKLAAYYASLEPAPPAEGPQPVYDDPLAAGRTAAAPCAKCHGDNGVSGKEGVPSLVGFSPKYLIDAIAAYKEGDRPLDEKNKDMKKALDALSEADVQHIALFYALQSEGLTRAQTPNPGGAAVAKDTLAVCAKCHGETGVSTGAATPSLAGQDFTYMLGALHAYASGTRDDDTMSPKVKKLPEADLKNLAAYYAALDPKPIKLPKPLSPAEWADKCDRCHGVKGNSIRPEVPAIAGQRREYLEKVLKAYQKGDRKSPEMSAMSSVLTDDDIKGIAGFYAYQKARPVVYITVPSK